MRGYSGEKKRGNEGLVDGGISARNGVIVVGSLPNAQFRFLYLRVLFTHDCRI